jgi:hypothetical protein
MRRSVCAALLFVLVACTASKDPTGTFIEIAVDKAAPSRSEPLLGGGTSFGMCVGYCFSELVIRSDGRVKLEMSAWHPPPPDILNEGSLTAEALAQAGERAAQLEAARLEEIYGCPDCADGGGAWVLIWPDGDRQGSTYEFRSPPAELERADGFLSALLEALKSCKATQALTIEPGCTPHPDL